MTEFALESLTGCIGARIDGIDFNQEIDDETFQQIVTALFQHKALLFPAQDLTPAAHVALGRRLGELVAHPDYPTIEGHEEIMVIENGPIRPPDNEAWHKDMTFRAEPPQCSLLHAKTLPPRGGDTMVANMEAALQDLSAPMRDLLGGLTAVHDLVEAFIPTLVANQEFERLEKMKAHPEELRRAVHPAIGVHPVTGNEYLAVDDCFITHFVELEAAESEMLLLLLREHIKQPRYQVRIHWQPNDLAIWDNICTLHYAVADYTEYRCMQRVTVSRFHDFADRFSAGTNSTSTSADSTSSSAIKSA